MLDVHTHLNDDKLFNNLNEVLDDIKKCNVKKVIVPSCDKIMNLRVLELIKNPVVFGAFGIHPSNSEEWSTDIEQLILNNYKNPKIVAVGEIGLDNHYLNSNIPLQKEVFLKQLVLADSIKLPIILHLRDAWDEFFDFYNSNKNLFNNGVDVHCFDGDKTIAKKLLDAGFYISLTALSVENKGRLKEMIEYLPLDRFMVETDSPYLLPYIYKHAQAYNSPKNVNYVAECVAKYKNITVQQVDEVTTKNAYTLFKKLGDYNE